MANQTIQLHNPHLEQIYQDDQFIYDGNINLLQRAHRVFFYGNQHPGPQQKMITKLLSQIAVNRNWTILTNFANGVNKISHLQALLKQQPTIAWNAGNLEQTFPMENDYLKSLTWIDNGLVITHQSNHFLNQTMINQSNAALVALSTQVIIVENNIDENVRHVLNACQTFQIPFAFVQTPYEKVNRLFLDHHGRMINN